MKNIKIKKRNKGKAKKKNKNTIPTFLKEKILYFRKVIRKTILIVQKYKSLDNDVLYDQTFSAIHIVHPLTFYMV